MRIFRAYFFLVLATSLYAGAYDPQLASKIDAFLTTGCNNSCGRSSPLAGNGAAFVASGLKWNVDPRLILAIAGAESSFGTKWVDCPPSGFNAWSYFYVRGSCPESTFDSFAQAIETMSTYIRRRYLQIGLGTIPEILSHGYCASSCASWIANVTTFYSESSLGSADPNDLTYAIPNSFSTAGTITVQATLDGTPWPSTSGVEGSISYFVAGPWSTIIGEAVPGETGALEAGLYTLTYGGGGPASAFEITPSATQSLTAGGAIRFSIDFSSEICKAGGSSANTSRSFREYSTGATCSSGTPLSVGCSVSPSSIALGQSATVTASATGGAPPYKYAINTTQVTANNSRTVTPGALGSYVAGAAVFDQSNTLANTTCGAQVVPASTFVMTTENSNQAIQAGQSAQYKIAVAPQNNFTGIIAWQVTGLPQGATIDNSSQQVSVPSNGANINVLIETKPTTPIGSYTLTLTGTSGSITNILRLMITVTAASMDGSCQVNGQTSPITLQVGSQATYSINASGGTPPLSYAWSDINGNDSNSASHINLTAGTYNVSVLVSDSAALKQQITIACPTVTVPAPPPVSAICNLSPNPISLGGGSTLTAGAIGGAPPYQFLLPGSESYSNIPSEVVMPSQAGAILYQVRVKDNTGQANAGECSVQVNGVAPTISSFSPDNLPHNRIKFSGTISGSAFTSSSSVYFCIAGSSTCFQQPAAGVVVLSLSNIRVTNVNLTTGTWQVEVVTQFGSVKSGTITVSP